MKENTYKAFDLCVRFANRLAEYDTELKMIIIMVMTAAVMLTSRYGISLLHPLTRLSQYWR